MKIHVFLTMILISMIFTGCGSSSSGDSSQDGNDIVNNSNDENVGEDESESETINTLETITTATISVKSSGQTQLPLTFGHTFKQGHIPSGSSIVAALDDISLPIQVDIKATHSDLSVRHAVISTIIPELSTAEKVIKLKLTDSPTENSNPVSISDVLNSEYDVEVDIDLHNIQVNTLIFGDRSTSWRKGDVITLLLNGTIYQHIISKDGDYSDGDDIGTSYQVGESAINSLKTQILSNSENIEIDSKYDRMYIKGTKNSVSFSLSVENSGSAPVTNEQLMAPASSNSYHIDVKNILQQAVNDKSYITWLDGDMASEWIISTPLFDSVNNVAHPQLAARFYIRAYKNISAIKTDIVIENTWAYEPNPTNPYYDVTINSMGDQVFNGSLEHYRQARWKKTTWWGDSANIDIKHNMRYLINSKALPNFDSSIVASESSLQSYGEAIVGEDYELMKIGSATPYMPQTGSHSDIGPLPQWQALYAVSGDKRVKKASELNSDLAGTWSVHYRDKDTGYPITIDDYPYMTILAGKGDTYNQETGEYEAFPTCSGYCVTPYVHDSAHQPTFSYLPYLVTGDYYHLEELSFWANYNLFASNPHYRQLDKGLFKPGQVRGQAWSLRTLGQAAYIYPDNHLLKNYFKDKVESNLEYYNEEYTENVNANTLGIIVNGYAVGYSENTGIAPWQQDFFTWSIGQLMDFGFDNATPFLDWLSTFQIGRMTDPEYCWISGATYSLKVRETSSSNFFTTMGETYRATIDSEIASLECASQEMASAFGLSNAGEMTGYSSSPSGYPIYFQAALAVITDYGNDDAASAWNVFDSRTVKPDYSTSPKYAIIPRRSDSSGNTGSDDAGSDDAGSDDAGSDDNTGSDDNEDSDNNNQNNASNALTQTLAGSWYEIPDTKLESVLPETISYGNTGPNSIITAWSGGTFNSDSNRLIVWGGGHADYAGNAIYTFDINTLQWERTWGPSLVEMIPQNPTESIEEYLDGNPSSRHTYDGLVYLPEPYSKLWSQGGSRWKNGYGTNATWQFDFTEDSWQRLEDAPDTHLGLTSAYDSTSNNIFVRSTYNINRYSVEEDEWTQMVHEGWGWWGDNTTATIATNRRKIIFIGGTQTEHVSEYGVYDIETKKYYTPNFTGDTEILSGNAPGVAYHPKSDTIIAWDGGTEIYQLNMDTWNWTKITPTNSADVKPGDSASTGTYGRFQYVPEYDIFIVVNDIYKNVFAFKLP